MVTFSNIDQLKRNRRIEGEIGIDLKIAEGQILVCLAATDANPRWTDKADKAFAELRRLSNAGAAEPSLVKRYAELYADAIVIGWHGGYDDDGKEIPFQGRDENDQLVVWSRDNLIAYLCQADDAMTALFSTIRETKNYRVARVEKMLETAKND